MRNGYEVMKRWMVWALVLCAAPVAQAEHVRLDASLAQPYVLATSGQKAYLRVALSGLEPADRTERAPINVAIVLDKSGSMSGEKMANARMAAIKAVNLLGPEDIVSVVAYDDLVHVIVPATKASDRQRIIDGINRIQAGGSTALFAGVSKGAGEVRKFLDVNRVNRVVLLSDGLANVGPSSPMDLAELGTSLGREGISVTTIGLGLDYNEDLMTQLAQKSDGNHSFAENATDLDRIFAREFGDVLSVVAQQVEITINCLGGAKPVRVIGRDAEIVGSRVNTSMNQLYGGQEKYVMLELDLPESLAGMQVDDALQVAQVDVQFNDSIARKQAAAQADAALRIAAAPADVDKNEVPEIMVDVIEQRVAEKTRQAVQLRDEGRVEEAKKVIEENAELLKEGAQKYDDKDLDAQADDQLESLGNIGDDADWKRERKVLREDQYRIQNQQQVN